MGAKLKGIIDVISDFNIELQVAELLEVTNRITPRYFTVSSDNVMSPNVVSITAAIDTTQVGKEQKVGLVSAYFQRLQQRFDSQGPKNISIRMEIVNSTFYLPSAVGPNVFSL